MYLLYVFIAAAISFFMPVIDRKQINHVTPPEDHCTCHTVKTIGVFSLSTETKQNSRIRAWESRIYLFLLPTQRLLPALVFCSPWLASPPGIFGHRLFLDWAIFPPSLPWPRRECEILGCVSDKAKRAISAGGLEVNDHIARKLPFCVLFFFCFFLLRSEQMDTSLVRAD